MNDFRLGAVDDLPDGAHVIVACSGGADSLALLALACANGFDVLAVYVDHGLRAGTEHDARVVASTAAALGARSRVVRVDVDGRANVEARARAARYEALERVRTETGAVAIFVAHTRDDQAETVLLNLLRGSGAAGLAGMPARRERIRRPLLARRRAETRELCARLGLAPVHDPMNDDPHHRRVWLRREVIPQLERGAARDIVEVLARQAELLRDDDDFLVALASEHDASDAALVTSLPVPLARRVVRTWLGPPPPAATTVDRVLAVARGDRRAVDLPGGDRVERVGGRLVRVGKNTATPAAVTLTLPGRVRFAAVEVVARIECGPPAAWPNGRDIAVCDADAVATTECTIRGPVAGERFQPLGRQGSKLVHDALAEAGIAPALRAASPVVATSGPVWVVGYRIDHRFRVTSRTQRFLWLSAEPART